MAKNKILLDCRNKMLLKMYEHHLKFSSTNSLFPYNFRKCHPAALPHYAEMHP